MSLLHAHRIEVYPGGRDPTSTDPNNRYCFGWAAFKSKTRTIRKGNPSAIEWRPGDLYENRRLCVLWRWQPGDGRVPGVMLNPHNPGDPAFGGWVPDNSSGVSAWAVDYFGDQVYANGASGLVLRLQGQPSSNRHFRLATIAEVEATRSVSGFFDVALDIRIADGTSGSVLAYVNGRPVQNLQNVKTCWRGQTAYWPYEGSYNSSGVPETQRNTYLPARYGRTPAECLADGVEWPLEEAALWGAVMRTDPSTPAWRHTEVPGVDHTAIVVPAEWGGDEPEPGPTPPPPPSSHGPLQQKLIDARRTFMEAALYKKWARDNPGEAEKVAVYWSQNGTPPQLATKTGQFLIRMGEAAWMAARQGL